MCDLLMHKLDLDCVNVFKNFDLNSKVTNNITNNISNNSKMPNVFYKRSILYNSSWHKINGSVVIPSPRGEAPGEGANLDRHLIPYHVKQGESNLASSLYIYLYTYEILALVNSLQQKLIFKLKTYHCACKIKPETALQLFFYEKKYNIFWEETV